MTALVVSASTTQLNQDWLSPYGFHRGPFAPQPGEPHAPRTHQPPTELHSRTTRTQPSTPQTGHNTSGRGSNIREPSTPTPLPRGSSTGIRRDVTTLAAQGSLGALDKSLGSLRLKDEGRSCGQVRHAQHDDDPFAASVAAGASVNSRTSTIAEQDRDRSQAPGRQGSGIPNMIHLVTDRADTGFASYNSTARLRE